MNGRLGTGKPTQAREDPGRDGVNCLSSSGSASEQVLAAAIGSRRCLGPFARRNRHESRDFLNAFGGCGSVDVGRWARVQVVSWACFVTVGANASVITSIGGRSESRQGSASAPPGGVLRVGIGSGAGGPMGLTAGVFFVGHGRGSEFGGTGREEAACARRGAPMVISVMIRKLPRSGHCRGVAAMCTVVYIFGDESQYKN